MASDNPKHGDKDEAEGASPESDSLNQDDQSADPDSESDMPLDVLEIVPSNRRAPFSRAFNSVTQIIAPAVNPIAEKINADHIFTMLANAENKRIREDEADKSRRLYQFAYFLIGLLAIIGLVVFFTLTDNRDLIAAIITGALGFLGGLAAGRYTRRN